MNQTKYLEIAKQLAARPQGFTYLELATATGLKSMQAGSVIGGYMRKGILFSAKRPSDRLTRYFLTREAGQAYSTRVDTLEAALQQVDLAAIARAAVSVMKRDFKALYSSPQLAQACHCSAATIDQALAHLADTRKLIRIAVMRGEANMFDYRASVVWVPCDADFAVIEAAAVPAAETSPVAHHKSQAETRWVTAPVTAAAPTAPTAPAGTVAATPVDALAAGAELGRKQHHEAPHAGERVVPASLGWQVAHEDPEAGALDQATLDAVTASDTPVNVHEASDLVCALNSRGEFVVDMGDGLVLKFPPPQAVAIKQFLVNTSVLESLQAQGLI